MLERLLIRNFQAHRKFELSFGPGVTTILGRSDSGKSSVLRALRWVGTNRPKGDDFVSHGTKSCEVLLVVDGREVARSKGKENLYRLDSAEYKAFGSEVPEDVARLLAVCELNFQRQLDAPYWLGDPAGKVSRELNEAVNLSLIDEATAKVQSIARKASADEEACLERIGSAEEELKRLPDLDALEGDVSAAETLERDLQSLRSKKLLLLEILEEIDRVKAGSSRAVPDLTEVKGVMDVLREVRLRREALQGLLGAVESKKEDLWRRERRAATIGAELTEALSKGCPVCGSPNPRQGH